MKYLYILLLCLGLCGCASMFPDMAIMQAENQGRIYRGMDLSQVETIVGRQPQCFYADRCRTEHLSDGDYFVWVVDGGHGGTNLMKTYSFRFKDNKLESWGNN